MSLYTRSFIETCEKKCEVVNFDKQNKYSNFFDVSLYKIYRCIIYIGRYIKKIKN